MADDDFVWQDWAACRGSDPSLFYPTDADEIGIEAAKAVCAACPVREACLDWAMAVNEKDGIWGGMDEKERRLFRRRTIRAKREHRPIPTPPPVQPRLPAG